MWLFKKRKEYAKVGDTVKCIDDRDWNSDFQNMNIVYGNKYKVFNVLICPTCGSVCYDIGGRFTPSKYHSSYTSCNKKHDLPGYGIHWAGAFRFEKSVESASEIEAKMEQAVEVENYELAEELKKELIKLK